MIKIIVQRSGHIRGASIIATRDAHNPYFLFDYGQDAENIKLFSECLEKTSYYEKTHTGLFPEYTVRTILVAMKWKRPEISYPEVGLIPSMQSVLMELFFELAKATGKDWTIHTVSEYMVRQSQVMVAKNIMPLDFCAVYDTYDPGGEYVPAKLEFTLPDEFTITSF